ncbi:MAG: hypothetical protein FWC81_04055 [Coriobacteriia bacterium]|nr:hypothetical protein [Coriobacteriia bacterium]
MKSEQNQQSSYKSGTASRVRQRYNYKATRYSDSYSWPGRSDVKPRAISSKPPRPANRVLKELPNIGQPARRISIDSIASLDNFDPYGSLNYGEMHLRSSKARQQHKEKVVSHRIALGLVALAIVLAAAGMLWMNYSNAAAQASDLLTSSSYELQSE